MMALSFTTILVQVQAMVQGGVPVIYCLCSLPHF